MQTERLKNAIVSSRQYSNCLYHFDKNPNRILDTLNNRGFTLNYVVEQFSFLNAKGLSTVAFPMICFCDIIGETARLEPHMRLYGKCGIGMTKEWGRKHGVQPVHYVQPTSPFSQDLRQAIDAASSLNLVAVETSAEASILSDFLITTLAFTKPLWGINDGTDYCFEDECEWRFIPTDLPLELPRFIPQPGSDQLDNYKRTLWLPDTYLLRFTYEDISDIFVGEAGAQVFCDAINELDATTHEKDLLKTKIREA